MKKIYMTPQCKFIQVTEDVSTLETSNWAEPINNGYAGNGDNGDDY